MISFFLELKHRSSLVDWFSPKALHHFSKGCSQGWFLGPFLWLVLLHSLLRNCIADNFTLIAYSDDIFVMVWCWSRTALERNDKDILHIVENWTQEKPTGISIDKCSVLVYGNLKFLKHPPVVKKVDENLKKWERN